MATPPNATSAIGATLQIPGLAALAAGRRLGMTVRSCHSGEGGIPQERHVRYGRHLQIR
jgi:hypothetical protein